MLLDLLVNGLFSGVPIAVAGLGFALIWYTSKEFHFLYGTLLAASAYGVYSLAEAGVNLVLAFVIVLVLAAALGALLKHQVYRRLGSPLSVLMLSFGLAIVLQNVLQIIYGPSDVVLSQDGLAAASITVIPGTDITRQGNDVLSLGILVVLWIVVAIVMNRSDIGLAMQAVMTDPEAAQYVGVRPGRIRWLAYAAGSAIGALSGALSMLGAGVRPTTGFDVMLYAFMATFLAGGVLARVPLWGLAIGVALGLVSWKLPTNMSTLIVFVLMLGYVVSRRHVTTARAYMSNRSSRRSLNVGSGSDMSVDYILTLVCLIVASVLLAMSLNLVMGYGGLLSVSHGASMGMGAYIAGVLSSTYGWDTAWTIVVGALGAGAIGWLFMAAVAALDPDDFILASFALQMIVVDLLLNWTPVTGGSAGLFGITPPSLFGYSFSQQWPFTIGVLVVGALGAGALIYIGRSGYAITLRAMRESERSVEATGHNVWSKKTVAWAVSSAFAGLAGGLYAVTVGLVTPGDFDVQRSIIAVAFILVGGIGNMNGAILGAIGLMILPEIVRNISAIPNQFQGPGQQIVYGVIIVMFVLLRPQGILSEKPILRLRRKGRDAAHALGLPPTAATATTGKVRANVAVD